jgi:DNA-binding NtrC family response regulator
VSRYHLEVLVVNEAILLIDHASTNGTTCGPVQIQQARIKPGSVLNLGRTSVRLEDRDERAKVELYAEHALGRLRGRTPVMRELMARIDRAAKSDVSVLLVGESGTGKDLIAEALHERSSRAGCPFVTVDCGALVPALVASELFGHERGAFTGADRQYVGAFERANGGTIFLDEIGELPATLQSNLLGVLERRRFRRLGGTKDIELDVRVVSATNRDLRAEVNKGTFRLDLYYRVGVVPLQVPALRDHADDIALLVEHFLRECGYDGPIERMLSGDALASLNTHHWPGNVRELRNLVESLVAMGEAPSLAMAPGLPDTTPGGSGAGVFDAVLDLTFKQARQTVLAEFEHRYLAHLLDKSNGNVAQASRLAKVDRSHLIDLLKRHRLK